MSALEHGNLHLSGATGGVLKRSHAAMKNLIDSALNDVRQAFPFSARGVFAVAGFIEDSAIAAALYSQTVHAARHGSRAQRRRDRRRGAHRLRDHCGGLPGGDTKAVFIPFTQHNRERTDLGLGLSIAKHSVEAEGGTMYATDIPGVGCVFTISLPAYR